LHAGSGDPSPYLPEPSIFDDRQQARVDPADVLRRAEAQRERAKKQENSVRRLLRRIFGSN
jgi:hypothetical protein